jgi:predicted RND superfamily exporter protein
MHFRRYIERYLFFLLRHRLVVSALIALVTIVLAYFMMTRTRVFTNFFDLYPPNHPYIKLYQQYRKMFGTANTVLVVVETKHGTIFDDPETVKKVERITLEFLHDIDGVNGEQVLSITHPKVKTTLAAGSGIKVVPLMYPRVPENAEDLAFLRRKVYTTEGVHGLFVSDDDKATQIVAGFWEEYFDLPAMWAKLKAMKERETDANHNIYITGPPVLYAYFLEAVPKMIAALVASVLMIVLILWFEFRSWQGVVIPVFSGALSAVWGLGFAGLCGISLDPLVLVIPLLISARAHSHSVQSVERYHEEYAHLHDRHAAIVKSYIEIFPPAMVALASDSLAILTLLVARIPLIQNLAILCSFWIASIFVSVVTLHPIILTFTPPPEHGPERNGALERFASWLIVAAIAFICELYGVGWARWGLPVGAGWSLGVAELAVLIALVGAAVDVGAGVVLPGYGHVGAAVSWANDRIGDACSLAYVGIERGLVWLSLGWRRPAMAVLLVLTLAVGVYYQQKVRIGDATPGMALLYPDHPYNVAFRKVNEKFLGASQLVIIAEGNAYCTVDGAPCEGDGCTKCFPENPVACTGDEQCVQRPGALKDADTLNGLDLFARYMAERPEVGGTVTAAALLKKIFRTFHEGDPKWEILPANNDHVAQLFFLLTSNTRRGEMDRFFDDEYKNATIQVFYKDYTHETISRSIARAKEYIEAHQGQDAAVRYRLAGGLIGILAAVNEEVEWSYRVNLVLILAVVFVLSYLTYMSVTGALIVMLPSLVAQPLSEAVMYLLGIDFNINSLPVAAVGIGIGIDYGYYVLSRMVEELGGGDGFDAAITRTFQTTGKTVLFTGVSLTASIIFWVFFPMKFQAQMALLLVLLLAFHLVGALVFIPPMVALLKPRFATQVADERARARERDERDVVHA